MHLFVPFPAAGSQFYPAVILAHVMTSDEPINETALSKDCFSHHSPVLSPALSNPCLEASERTFKVLLLTRGYHGLRRPVYPGSSHADDTE